MAKKTKAVFLDRDGTIIRHVDYLTDVSQIRIIPRVARFIKSLSKLGFLVIVVTNQSVVARGLVNLRDIDEIHAVLIKWLEKQGAKIDAVYFCPHHPEMHPDVPKHAKQYRIVCDCRKPSPGMIISAIKKFNIDCRKSFIIGDSIIDIVAGKRAKIKTILVETGPGHRLDKKYIKEKPDFIAKNLSESLKFIKIKNA